MLRITVSKVGESPRTVTFDKREISVGRTPANDLVIAEPGVSSAHARILFTGTDITMIDLESTNGTFVNGQRIQGPCLLSGTEEVFICAHRLQFEVVKPGVADDSASVEYGAAAARVTPPVREEMPPAPVGSVSPGPSSAFGAPAAPAAMQGVFGSPPPLLNLSSETPAEAAMPEQRDPPSALPEPEPLPPEPLPAHSPPLGPEPAPPGLVSSGPKPVYVEPGPTFPPSLQPLPVDGSPAVDPPVRTGRTIRSGDSGPASPASPVGTPVATPVSNPMSKPAPASAPAAPPSAAPNWPPAQPWGAPATSVVRPPSHITSLRTGVPRPATLTPVVPSPPVARAGVSVVGVVAHRPHPPEGANLPHLDGAALMEAVCARVFASVHDSLGGGTLLPDLDEAVREQARMEARALLSRLSEGTPEIAVGPWSEQIAGELCGFGPLSPYLEQPDVAEIFIRGPREITVRRDNGETSRIDIHFSCPQAVEVVIKRICGVDFSCENPILDIRTGDGRDVYGVHDAIAADGPVVTIATPATRPSPYTLERLLHDGWMSPGVANLLETCVAGGVHILVCAESGARAMPLELALLDAAPATDRQVLVRPLSEPGPLPSGVIALQGDGLIGSEGTTVMQALVRSAIGLRPDRLAVHELAGAETAEVLAAAGRGLSQVIMSTRANTAHEGMTRLASLVGLAGGYADPAARLAYVASSLELVLTVGRLPDGRMAIVEVAEADLTDGHLPVAVPILRRDSASGRLTHTGTVPRFFAALRRRGLAVDENLLKS